MSEWYDDTAHLKAILEYNCMKQYLMKHEKKNSGVNLAIIHFPEKKTLLFSNNLYSWRMLLRFKSYSRFISLFTYNLFKLMRIL